MVGKALRVIYRAKRQAQKLIYRGKIDLRSGSSILKKHMKASTSFTSNISMERLEGK